MRLPGPIVRATQATISRDVSEMGLIKQTKDGERGYAMPPRIEQLETTGEERLAMVLRDLPVEIRPAGLLIVVKAVPKAEFRRWLDEQKAAQAPAAAATVAAAP